MIEIGGSHVDLSPELAAGSERQGTLLNVVAP